MDFFIYTLFGFALVVNRISTKSQIPPQKTNNDNIVTVKILEIEPIKQINRIKQIKKIK